MSSCALIHVMCFYMMHIFSFSWSHCACLANERALLPPFYLLTAAAFCRWKWKTIRIFVWSFLFNIYCWYDTHYMGIKYFDWTAIYSRLYIENEFVILKSRIMASSSYVIQMCFCKRFLSTSEIEMHCNIKKKSHFGDIIAKFLTTSGWLGLAALRDHAY